MSEIPRYKYELRRCRATEFNLIHPDIGMLKKCGMLTPGLFAWWKAERLLKRVYGDRLIKEVEN